MTIALMRHGQTDWNLAGRVQGHTNIPLNETGREQAAQAAHLLLEGDPWHVITSSPLDRACETAQIIADHLDMPLADPHEGLIEQRYGIAEGLSVKELNERWPNRDIEGGEPPAELASRALTTLESLHEAHAGSRVLAVTHGAYIRRLVSLVTERNYQDVPGIKNASLTLFEREGSSWNITMINGQPTDAVFPPAAPAFASLTPMGGDAAGFCTIDGVCN